MPSAARHRPSRQPAPSLQQQLPELREGQSVALLQALHILTREGKLNQDTRRKLKQVNHLVQFIEPLLTEVLDARGDVVLADHGAGKSYLGFILYDLVLRPRPAGQVIGVETREELVIRSRALATELGFERMRFLATTVQQSMDHPDMPERIDVVTALHACDTATDDAIDFGLAHGAQHMVLVPCCQAEAAGVMRQHKALALKRTPLAELWRHPLHTREMGSQITNVLRCLRLEAHGYQVTVTELVGWEHSMKNELILARKMPDDRHGQRERARERLLQVLDAFGLQAMQTRFAV
ncbi:MAG: SAM-dependent methyltransferase [Hydrogenophaga sp.]|uniref:class I SAM-dependent methyltransferase n=1 Tax=Hydrogenophaga sp. TaxID=1904254 RepID=UPI001D4BDFAE|nr:SAM-dependent methyltransferase [Hydrogenophaga sp.]MBX3609337.1 SAM-dependent methyltransferase [Hydrogenophaga sp.]